MKLQDQHLFSLINTIRKKDRFYFFISDKKNYIFDGISYSFFEIENIVARMLNFGNDKQIMDIIENLPDESEKNRLILKLNMILSKQFNIPSYEPNKKIAFLSLNIGNKCNLNCKYCFRRKEKIKKTNFELVKKSIDFLIANKPDAEFYSIAIDLSSEVFLERDVIQKTIDYFFEKECYLFEDDELIKGSPLSFYNMLPDIVKEKNCRTDSEALVEINRIIKKPNLLDMLGINTIKEKNPYLYNQSKIVNVLPMWKLVRLNHWAFEAFFSEYVKHKDKKSFSLWFMSNGTIITKKDIDLIKGLEINPFLISLDGPETVHNKLRPYLSGKGSYNDVIKSIRLLQNHSIDVKVSLVLTNLYPYPYELINFLLSLNIYQVKMTLVRNNTELQFTKNTIKTLKNSYRKLFNHLKEDLLKNDFTLFNFLADDISLKPLRALINKSLMLKRCMWNEELIINSEGDIYPCTYTNGIKSFSKGNVLKNTYDTKLEHALFIDNRTKCKQCWAKYICGGTCYFNTYMEKTRIDSFESVECSLNNFLCKQCLELFVIMKTNNCNINCLFEKK